MDFEKSNEKVRACIGVTNALDELTKVYKSELSNEEFSALKPVIELMKQLTLRELDKAMKE